VRQSPLGGYGVFPCGDWKALLWSDIASTPVLVPYLGVETVVKDADSLRALIEVLKGHFECVTIAELQAKASMTLYVMDRLFAIPQGSAPNTASKKPLPLETKMLQVKCGDDGSACYLLADDALTALHLDGRNAHLFDLLCAHAKHEHAERHLATHVASLHRKEEGYVLINAHPAFGDPLSIAGMINEPTRSGGRRLRRSRRDVAAAGGPCACCPTSRVLWRRERRRSATREAPRPWRPPACVPLHRRQVHPAKNATKEMQEQESQR